LKVLVSLYYVNHLVELIDSLELGFAIHISVDSICIIKLIRLDCVFQFKQIGISFTCGNNVFFCCGIFPFITILLYHKYDYSNHYKRQD